MSPSASPASPSTPRHPAPVVTQRWENYTADQHRVWATLYQRRMEMLRVTGSRAFLDGAEAIGLRPDRVPDLAEVNRRLSPRTGWQAVPVAGFLPARAFFASLAERRFPTTVTVRSAEQLEYLPEPDIFHDVFGHVPLHAEPVFADCLQRFGALQSRATSDHAVEQLARLFWFTVEFGLIAEEGRTKVYGSGLISSAADAANALSSGCERRPFSLDAVLAQPFEIDRLQPVLFVLTSFDQLYDAVDALGRRL